MGKSIRNAVVAAGAAALIVAPAAPAAAQNDCIYSGAEYVVHDTIDCVRTILMLVADLPPN